MFRTETVLLFTYQNSPLLFHAQVLWERTRAGVPLLLFPCAGVVGTLSCMSSTFAVPMRRRRGNALVHEFHFCCFHAQASWERTRA